MASALCGDHLAKVAKALGYKVDQLPETIIPLEFPEFRPEHRNDKEASKKREEEIEQYHRAVRQGHPHGKTVRTHRVYLNSTGKDRKHEWKILFHTAFELKKNGMDPDCDCEKCNVRIAIKKEIPTKRR
jgi:hypothetical protein